MSREDAAEKLKHLPDGSFLLRDSLNATRRGNPALSIKFSGTVRHIRIEQDKEGMFYMADTRSFHTLPQLVEYYQQNQLSDSFPDVKTTLLHPVKTVLNGATGPAVNGVCSQATLRYSTSAGHVLCYATALYDYAATATSQISLKTGDKIAVLSKAGRDKGWWKGEHINTNRVGYFPFAYVKEDDED